jgi:hypothetical protein
MCHILWFYLHHENKIIYDKSDLSGRIRNLKIQLLFFHIMPEFRPLSSAFSTIAIAHRARNRIRRICRERPLIRCLLKKAEQNPILAAESAIASAARKIDSAISRRSTSPRLENNPLPRAIYPRASRRMCISVCICVFTYVCISNVLPNVCCTIEIAWRTAVSAMARPNEMTRWSTRRSLWHFLIIHYGHHKSRRSGMLIIVAFQIAYFVAQDAAA